MYLLQIFVNRKRENTHFNNIVVLFFYTIILFWTKCRLYGVGTSKKNPKKALFAICLVVVSLFLGLTLGLSSFVFFTGL